MALPISAFVAAGKEIFGFAKDNPGLGGALGPVGAAGAIVGTIGGIGMADTMGRGIINIPGVDLNWGGILPGGDPFIVPEGPAQGWTYGWTANGQVFYRSGKYIGTYYGPADVYGNRAWKSWTAYHPIVFGKRDDPRKLARIIKRHHGAWKELNKVFGKHHREAPRRK